MNIASIKTAAFQMLVTPDVDKNLEKIKAAIEAAADSRSDVLVLPECAVSGYPPLHHKEKSDIDLPRVSEANSEIVALAGERGIWVIAGTITQKDRALYNSALVISPHGLVGQYDKMHLIGDDGLFFGKGRAIPTFDFGGAPFGVQICYDVRFPEPFRYLKARGATVVFCIFNACQGATWKVPVLEGTCRSRAAENHYNLVAVNAAGPMQMVVSRICDPDGVSMAEANQDEEDMIYARLDLSSVGPGFYADRRTDLYDVVFQTDPIAGKRRNPTNI